MAETLSWPHPLRQQPTRQQLRQPQQQQPQAPHLTRRQQLLSVAALAGAALAAPPGAWASGILQLPVQQLNNTYYLVRAGQSVAESEGYILTNPVSKTSLTCGLSREGKQQVRRLDGGRCGCHKRLHPLEAMHWPHPVGTSHLCQPPLPPRASPGAANLPTIAGARAGRGVLAVAQHHAERVPDGRDPGVLAVCGQEPGKEVGALADEAATSIGTCIHYISWSRNHRNP